VALAILIIIVSLIRAFGVGLAAKRNRISPK
jgi:hypothetical protein